MNENLSLEGARPRPPIAPNPPPAERATWGAARRVGLRFLFVYALLFFAFAPLGPLAQLPPFGLAADAYYAAWGECVRLFGRYVLRLPGDVAALPTSSGDQAYGYVALACRLALALALAAGWSALDRRRANDARLGRALRGYVRFSVALTMFVYGLAKVTRTQFLELGPEHLARTYGESSPMGLLWTFMGYSTAYNVFTGAGEVLGALLLLSRRAASLGALVTFGIMANVVMLNFCYDVPVKLTSTHLALASLGLLAADGRRLARVLLLGRSAEALPPPMPWRSRRLERAWPAIKVAFAAAALGFQAWDDLDYRKAEGPDGPEPELYGTYRVESFERAGDGPAPWAAVAFGQGGLVLRRADGTGQSWRVSFDAGKRIVGGGAPTAGRRPGEGSLELTYERVDAERVRLEGTVDGERLVAHLAKAPEPPSLLMSRGFHWVNPFPFNR
jgi:hypothetical protein